MSHGLIDTTFVVRLASGESRRVQIMVGTPCYADTGEWWCPVEMRGLFDQLGPAVGADALQALALALRLVFSQLEAIREAGGEVFDAEGKEPVALDAYLESGFRSSGPPN